MAEQIPFSIIENALSSLGSSVVKKLGSMYGVGKELKKLEQTLGTLKAILLDAEEQLEKSYAVKDWVKRMKEVVYDVDDLLDDFATYQLRRGGPARQIKFVGAPSLKCLSIGRIDRMKSLPKEILQHISGLEKLHIYECSELESLELPSFPSLSKLDIKFCPLSVSFKVDQLPSLATLHLFSVGYDVIQQIKFVGAPSLKCLSIEYIDRLISLPKEVLQHFSGLVRLHIRECRALQSLELPSFHALSKLRIEDCPNLASFNVASLTRLRELRLRRVTAEVLQQLMLAFSSLKLLYIWGIYGKITHLQHDSTLESLSIWNCSGLETLQHWMSSLSSLRALAICHCPELTSLPKEIYSLQKLETLYLSGFQLTDEDRAKIARLPDINLTMDSLADDEIYRIFFED